MDEFRAKGFNDYHLPYNERTLPDFLQKKDGKNLRQAFLDAQSYFLTDAKLVETDGASTHFVDENGDNIFQPIRSLGQGSYGGVDLVYSRLSLRHYARKRVLRGRDSERSREGQRTLIAELKHLKQLSHRHLVKIIASYTDLEYISYIMEPVAESDLARRLATPGMISTEQQSVLRRFYGCLAGAVNYLHQNQIRHRDITARNILIYQDEVYISDFGSAYSWSNRPASATRHHYTPVSPDYQAPEVAKREERDSKSDMFSLGVVFLEMTTKLLGRSIADLKRVISMNARRHNSDQPYVHANLPVVLTWLDELRKGNTVEHDNEPLVWVRDLLQEKPRNRPSAKGLMKDILESPSFRSFCCFKCQGEFEERAFEYDAGVQRDEPMEDIKATKNTVADIFDEEGSSLVNGISLQKSQSVEQWLGVTVIDRGSEANMPGAFPEIQDAYERVDDARRIDDTSVLFSATQYQSWYDTAELHEGDRWYAQSGWANETAESIPQPHNIASPTIQSDLTAIGPETSGRERNLHDTGLGFMEYGSSDSEEDAEPQMFEEYSDSSDTSSENESASTANTPSKANTSTKELGIIVEVDESQSEEGALEEDDNDAYKFEEVSDDSTIEETEELEQELRADNLEPMGDSVDSYYPRGKARSDVELPFSTVARHINNPYTDVNLEETAVKGPKAVTCEDDPEIAIPDLPRDECCATLDLAGPVLIEWSAEHDIKQGPSVLDESYKSPGQPRRSLESSLDDVSQFAENIDGIGSPSSTASQTMPGEGQIQYGNALISHGQDTTDIPPGAGLSDVQKPKTNNDSISEETEQVERTVRFALPSPSSPQYTEPPLNLPGFTGQSKPQGNSLIPIGDDSEGMLLDFRMRLKQLEQESASEQNSQWPALEASSTGKGSEALTQISSSELEARWAANSPEDGRHELEHNVDNSLGDVNAEVQTQLDSGIFFATEIRGVFSRGLLPRPMVPQRRKAYEALRTKMNLRALDIAKTTDETATGRSLQSTPIPRLPLTAANVKALRDAAHRPSPNQNSSSLQLQGSTPNTLPRPQPDLPGSHETNQDSSHMGSSSSRNPRQRTALPTINAKSLMKTAWESASASAPTSVMSDATKARLSRVLVPYNQYDRMQNLLKDYCKQGKASAVKFLLQKGCNPGTRKTPRRGPLLAAIQGASGRHNKCVRELIKHDVDVNIKSKKSGKSALHLAVENDPFQGYVKLVWLLVNAGAETNMPDENGDFPLTKVFFGAGSLPLEKNRLEALAVLLRGGAEPNLHASGTGNTPLHLAVRRQDKWAVAMLLHKGADVNAKNSSGATPLQMTANQFRGDLGHDHAQVLDLLLQAKARIDERAGALSRTALHLAIISGTAHAVKLLLDYGADPLLADKNGNTAIMLAIKGAAKMTTDPEKIEDHVEVMDRLVKRLGPSWTHASSPKGVCAVETACSGYNMDLLKALLVEGNLDPRSKFREGTVVEFARATGTPRVKEVIERHMDKKRTME
ncbi:hypothetical protein Daus18300_011844 [Diaporthe australafricana]|uniref:EKC/KEOPS complex subunit BUD32 n=1 Tax=Diaporthe australafricana TaxID=127596 RepID=A0ABR3W558_9PEZI